MKVRRAKSLSRSRVKEVHLRALNREFDSIAFTCVHPLAQHSDNICVLKARNQMSL